MANLIELKKELESYKNTLVISDFDNEVVRLVNVVDEEDDYYWVFDTEKGIIHASCVGGWIALKGVLPDKDYKRLVDFWNSNNLEKAV